MDSRSRRAQDERIVAAARAESRANLRAHQDAARAAHHQAATSQHRATPANPSAAITAIPTNVESWRSSDTSNDEHTDSSWFW